jgi:NAD(P)H dehydrogenase (quinone)
MEAHHTEGEYMGTQQASTSKPQKPTCPVILIIGATGLTGRYIIDEFDREPGDVHIRLAARRPEQIERLRAEGRDAVLLDLDDPRTFGAALAGVDRLFLLTGYTVAMLAQSKTLVDAAKKARVQHIVHLGIFGNWDCTDPHFAWHQLVECYIEASGIAWTHLHPNVFMELLPTFMPIRDGAFPVFWDDRRVGWIASRDIAAVAAAALRDGPQKHSEQNYWLSAEVAGGPEIATLLTEVLGRDIRCDIKHPDEFKAAMSATGDYPIESWYAEGTLEALRQILDGRMGYIGTVRDDAPFLTGRPSMTLRQWAEENRERLEKPN